MYVHIRYVQTRVAIYTITGGLIATKYAAADVKSIRLISTCAATVSEWLTAWLMHVNHLCVISVRVMLCSCLCSIRRFTSLIVDQFAKLSINHTTSRLRDAIVSVRVVVTVFFALAKKNNRRRVSRCRSSFLSRFLCASPFLPLFLSFILILLLFFFFSLKLFNSSIIKYLAKSLKLRFC